MTMTNVGYDSGGLVGKISYYGTGDTLIENSAVSGTIIGAHDNIGGLVGQAYSTSNNLTISHSSANVIIDCGVADCGYGSYGGLVGYTDGPMTIEDSFTQGSIGTAAEGSNYLGGLVGDQESSQNLNISNSYSTDTINGGYDIGGLIGYANHIDLTNVYSSGQVTSSNDYTGGLVAEVGDGSILNSFYAPGTALVYVGESSHALVGVVDVYDGINFENNFYSDVAGLDNSSDGNLNYNGTLVSGNSYFQGNSTNPPFMSADGTTHEWDFNTVWQVNQNDFPTLLAEGTSTPTLAPSSGSSLNSSSSPSAPICTGTQPTAPDLFQIDVNGSQARLYYAPVTGNDADYYISYGLQPNTFIYGTDTGQGNSTGVLSYTVNMLNPNTIYYFEVRGQNGCMPGNWSNVMEVKTGGKGVKTTVSYYKGVPVSFPTTTTHRHTTNSQVQGTETVVQPTSAPTPQPTTIPSATTKKTCFLWWCW
jgi:hypothetical protein